MDPAPGPKINPWLRAFIPIVVLLLVAVIVTIKFGFLPNSPCDCGNAARFSLYTIDFRECVYRGLYRSEQYTECSRFGQSCRDFMEAHGVDCSGDRCGGPTLAERTRLDTEMRIAQLEEEMRTEMRVQMERLASDGTRNLTRFDQLSKEQIALQQKLWTPEYFEDPFATGDYYREMCR